MSTISEWANSVYRIETEKRRLALLIYLASTPGYEVAASLLHLHCKRVGIPSTADQVLAAVAWLVEQELIAVRDGGPEPIARLTVSGRETALGERMTPGVMRPDP